eukprot:COSAG02_NODE_49040_length_329_cov_1.352174_1_plen_29_part_10
MCPEWGDLGTLIPEETILRNGESKMTISG